MIEVIDFDELKKKQEQKAEQEQEKAVALTDMTDKSIADVSLSDIHFKLNTTQSYEEQAKDVVNAMATAKAVKDQRASKTNLSVNNKQKSRKPKRT